MNAPSFAIARRLVPSWPGWSRLPREARDTLFLLAVIAWTVLPHVEHLPAWAIALTAVVLVWRGRIALVNAALPSRWVLVAMLFLAAGLTLWSYRTLLGKEPGVTLAVALMALKTLELRAKRDAFVVFFLGFFIILTHFLYSQSLLVAFAMLVSVWGLLTAVVLAHMPVGQPSLKQAGWLAARTALLGAPVMALLFLLFPRIGPLWGVPQDGISKTGLSNVMKMGSMTEVARDEGIAMRIRFEGAEPSPPQMYFRGPVLTRFDGIEWTQAGLPYAPAGIAARPAPVKTTGEPLAYEATFEPLRLASVPLLEATTDVQGPDEYRIVPREDLQWLSDRPVIDRLRVKGVAYPRFALGASRRPGEIQDALALPDGFNPRTVTWAKDFRDAPEQRGASPTRLVQALLQHIRTSGFSYTLSPGEYGRNAIDEFWLDRKEGFCEHFASAFVVILRAAGVPARVVTGYQGTDTLPVDGYYVVRQSSAHAWAEYFQQGIGWIRADPTGAVAPDRIGSNFRLAPQAGFVAGTLGAMNPQLLEQLRTSWEAINNRWNQWILNYTRGQQLDVMKQLGFATPTWEDLAILLVGTLSGLALAGAIWAWLDRHRVDPWVRQLDRMKRALRALGLEAASHDTPRALAVRVRARLGDAGEPLAARLDRLEAQRYSRDAARRPDASLGRGFALEARRLRSLAPR